MPGNSAVAEPGTMAARNARRRLWSGSGCCEPSTMNGRWRGNWYCKAPSKHSDAAYIDTHCHLDYAILNRKFGSYENWCYKTALCWYWEQDGYCYYEDTCNCAHGWDEYRDRPQIDTADALEYFSAGLLGKGCAGLITSCSEVESIDSTILLVQAGLEHLGGSVYCSFGMHPHNYDEYTEKAREQLVAGAEACGDQLVAWGECGLDYVKNDPSRTHERRKMLETFEAQVWLARERRLPLVIHSRGAEEDTLQVLKRAHPLDGGLHVHGYQESPGMMRELFHRWKNCYIGLAGLVCCPHAPHMEEVVKEVPLNRFVLETDAPYLSVNAWEVSSSASQIPSIAARIAEIKGLPIDVIWESARTNTGRLYGM